MLKRTRPQRPAKSIDQIFDAFSHPEQLLHLSNECFESLIREHSYDNQNFCCLHCCVQFYKRLSLNAKIDKAKWTIFAAILFDQITNICGRGSYLSRPRPINELPHNKMTTSKNVVKNRLIVKELVITIYVVKRFSSPVSTSLQW